VEKITREELERFHNDYWKPGSSALVLAGDISLDGAVALAKTHFGSWTGGAAAAMEIPSPRPLGSGKVFVVDRQDAAQTVVAQILPGPKRSSEDYYAFRLADTVWAGSFKSRLDMNLREEKGYSYGIISFTTPYREAGAWVATGGVQTDKTRESVVEFHKELVGIADEKPVTEKELAEAKALRVRSYAQQFESLGRITDQLAALWEDGRPISELDREPAEFQRSTPEAVNAVAKKYARPDGGSLLLVGDWAKIMDGVRQMDLGPIVVLDVEGRIKEN
jgi:predicted Zn-dependent peptidase